MVELHTFVDVLKLYEWRCQAYGLLVLLKLDVSDGTVYKTIFEDQKCALICPAQNFQVLLHPWGLLCLRGIAWILLCQIGHQLQDQLATAVRVSKHIEVLLLQTMLDRLLAQRVSLTQDL